MTCKRKFLFTGGSGLLGKEIQKHFPGALFPSSRTFNVTKIGTMESFYNRYPFEALVHMAAVTNTKGIETEKCNTRDTLETNIIGTTNVVRFCMDRNIRLVYISTDYVFSGHEGNYKEYDSLNPVNKYAWSKLGRECACRLYANSLIIRTSFCAEEFTYEGAITDQYTTRLPVGAFAEKLSKYLLSNPMDTGVKHIFGDKKTVYELALELSPEKEIIPLKRFHIGDYPLPEDTSLSTGVGKEI